MFLLIIYVVIALGFSFICSIAEAVILSVSQAYIALLEKDGKPSGTLLNKLTSDINKPLSAIITLNTVCILYKSDADDELLTFTYSDLRLIINITI